MRYGDRITLSGSVQAWRFDGGQGRYVVERVLAKGAVVVLLNSDPESRETCSVLAENGTVHPRVELGDLKDRTELLEPWKPEDVWDGEATLLLPYRGHPAGLSGTCTLVDGTLAELRSGGVRAVVPRCLLVMTSPRPGAVARERKPRVDKAIPAVATQGGLPF